MPLSEAEQQILIAAGKTGDLTQRRQAVAIVHRYSGADHEQARSLLATSFIDVTQPSFHLIPRGNAMTSELDFTEAYELLAERTHNFTDISANTLSSCLEADPRSLVPLRMIIGFTHNEMAVAMRLVAPDVAISGGRLKIFERTPVPTKPRSNRKQMISIAAHALRAVMEGEILFVPEEAAANFHSKLDKTDTKSGWTSVSRSATDGVPYSALLYQRYVGGAWRQVQDAYSEVKGDALLELPLTHMLTEESIPFYRSPQGASGARATAALFDLNPGPDFILPPTSPTVVIESKIGEDGGTVRDKASRIRNLADAAHARGLIACAVVDGKGWRERPNAMVDVVLATEGRTYTLSTMKFLLQIPEISSLARADLS
jgi:hypothetical protein